MRKNELILCFLGKAHGFHYSNNLRKKISDELAKSASIWYYFQILQNSNSLYGELTKKPSEIFNWYNGFSIWDLDKYLKFIISLGSNKLYVLLDKQLYQDRLKPSCWNLQYKKYSHYNGVLCVFYKTFFKSTLNYGQVVCEIVFKNFLKHFKFCLYSLFFNSYDTVWQIGLLSSNNLI